MTTAEKERLALYEQLNSTLGPEPAETLMEHLPPQKWADLATKEDLRLFAKEHGAEITELRAEMQAGFARIDGQFAQVMSMFAHIDGRFAQVESQFAQVDSRFAEMDSKFAEMESKFAQQTRTIVLALGGFAATIWASMLTTALIVT